MQREISTENDLTLLSCRRDVFSARNDGDLQILKQNKYKKNLKHNSLIVPVVEKKCKSPL